MKNGSTNKASMIFVIALTAALSFSGGYLVYAFMSDSDDSSLESANNVATVTVTNAQGEIISSEGGADSTIGSTGSPATDGSTANADPNSVATTTPIPGVSGASGTSGAKVSANPAKNPPALAKSGEIKDVAFWEGKYDLNRDISECKKRLDAISSDGSIKLYNTSYTCFDPMVAMWRATGNTKYLDAALKFVEDALAITRPTPQANTQGFLGWKGRPGKWKYEDMALDESILFRYVTQMLREMKERPEIISDPKYLEKYSTILAFSEKNMLQKWDTIKFGKDDHAFYRERTNVASHWAYICLNLALTTEKPDIKSRCEEIRDNITFKGMERYGGASLVSQLIAYPDIPGAFIWSTIWGNTPNEGDSNGEKYPGDVNHVSAEAGYLLEAYEYGIIDKPTIDGVLTTTRSVIFNSNGDPTPTWLDGVNRPCPKEYATSACGPGNLASDGFIKLGRLDVQLQKNIEKFSGSVNTQHIANAALNASILLGTAH